MLIPLAEVLQMPAFRAADPVVHTGDPQQAMVRWVHSSEVFEMGSLLAGGEVLLTSGLGLHGRTSEQLASYVREVAEAGCVAVVMEMGRSFFSVPESMLAEARRQQIVFVTLHTVVPFERIVEDFHDLVLQRKLGAYRYGEHSWDDLLAVVLAGEGLRALLDAISRSAGCEVEFLGVEGQLVERSRISSTVSATQHVATQVRGAVGPLGTLVLRGQQTSHRHAVAERGAVAVALELSRFTGVVTRPSLAQSLVADLAAGSLLSSGDVLRRLAEAGWAGGERWQGATVAVVDADPRRPIVDEIAAADEAFSPTWGKVLVGSISTHVVVIGRGVPAPHRLREQAAEIAERLTTARGGELLLGVARPVAEPGDLPDAVRSARDVVRFARTIGQQSGTLLQRDVGLQRLLSRVDAAAVSDFVSEQMGGLIDHDRAHASQLVKTLDAFVACRGSKREAADRLGIRRQSLYARLARIERLLGVDLSHSGHVAALSLALVAWRMRTGLDPQSGFGAAPYDTEPAGHRP
ncbi:PucR family transcriptional regulator [Aeromicrobium phragmitis]|uniref:PucR family transcriptional regulator n=1 Tax=Aeromicrobium phragmitis TaxID=2478914 RepID=A0A3L8PQ80_9ACTN|nr:PucR family transcriptional regulator [Aeromicrobium phragmitis]RLV56863.1 PucR family transcriptional regulator [Aeromicrobium phragmitis]